MIHSILLAAAQSTVPSTPAWSLSTALLMIVCNIFGLLLARNTVQKPGVGPASPVPGLSLAQLLAGTSFGHILGAGVILGLGNAGIL